MPYGALASELVDLIQNERILPGISYVFKVGEDVPSLNDYNIDSFNAPFANKQQRVCMYEPAGKVHYVG